VLLVLLGLAPARADAQREEPVAREQPRGAHVRSHLSGHGAMAIPLGASGFLAGAGLATGVEVAVHPNHDVGVRGYATWLPYDTEAHRRWETHSALELLLIYRFHDDVAVDRVAPFLELGVGVGGYAGCLNGDFCGGFGLGGVVGGGVEVALHRYFSLVAGAQVLVQAGMVNGVSLVLLPSLMVGARAG
jgi:hypothetical protein